MGKLGLALFSSLRTNGAADGSVEVWCTLWCDTEQSSPSVLSDWTRLCTHQNGNKLKELLWSANVCFYVCDVFSFVSALFLWSDFISVPLSQYLSISIPVNFDTRISLSWGKSSQDHKQSVNLTEWAVEEYVSDIWPKIFEPKESLCVHVCKMELLHHNLFKWNLKICSYILYTVALTL